MDRDSEDRGFCNSQEPPKRNTRLMLMGALLLLLGFGWSLFQYYQVKVWNSALAEVVSVKTVTSSSGGGSPSTTYQPTLRFKDANGKEHTVTTGYSSSQFNFEEGERIPISYDPKSPNIFRITTFAAYWVLPIVATSFGLIVFYFSGGFRRLARV